MSERGWREPAVTRTLDDGDRLDVHALLTRAAGERGFWPLSDQLAADLDRPSQAEEDRPIHVLVRSDAAEPLAGYGQASRRKGGWTMQVVTVGPPSAVVTDTLAGAVVDAVDRIDRSEIDWWVFMADGVADPVAHAHGFVVDRDLLQMQRDLPVGRRAAVRTRSFVVGFDESSWLALNNRAFAGHAEQGAWTIETLRQRMVQPWFDPQGFRLHERDGRLAAFCWTKIHSSAPGTLGIPAQPSPEGSDARARDARIGEIYVIGVDPDFQGLGLGRELTLAGLDHMVAAGVHHAMLYVDGSNETAGVLYRRLGFLVHRTDRAFRRPSIVSA